jgi:hypothetical protein
LCQISERWTPGGLAVTAPPNWTENSWKFNLHGRLTAYNTYSIDSGSYEENSDSSSTNYSYDANDNITYHAEGSSYVRDDYYGSDWSSETYDYDTDHNVLRCYYRTGHSNRYESSESGYSVEYDYNDREQQIKITGYNEDGTISGWSDSIFDEHGQLIEQASYSADGSLTAVSGYAYNERGDRIESLTTKADGTRYGNSYDYRYNAQGQLLQAITYDLSGNISGGWQKRYDSRGNLLQSSNISRGGFVSSKARYDYDSQGQLLQLQVLGPKHTMVLLQDNRYDAEGHLLGGRTYQTDGSLQSRVEFRYDQNGRRQEGQFFGVNNVLNRIEHYAYAPDGRIQTITVYGEELGEWRYSYGEDGYRREYYRYYPADADFYLLWTYFYNPAGILMSAFDFDIAYDLFYLYERSSGCAEGVEPRREMRP